MTTHLRCEDLTLSYGQREVLRGVSLSFTPGEVTALVGPNACGKSSLLRCLTRVQKPSGGTVFLDDAPIQSLNTRQVARHLAFLPQNATAPAGMRVFDLVLRGRTPHQSPLQQWSSRDQEIVEEALARVGLAKVGDRLLSELSGGQVQRAWIAMILAQDTDILVLDEPTTFLDLPNQRDVLNLLSELQADRTLTVVMVLHDINLAARYADRIVALRDGLVQRNGPIADTVTADAMVEIYGIDCTVIPDPHHGHPHVIMK